MLNFFTRPNWEYIGNPSLLLLDSVLHQMDLRKEAHPEHSEFFRPHRHRRPRFPANRRDWYRHLL